MLQKEPSGKLSFNEFLKYLAVEALKEWFCLALSLHSLVQWET